MQRFSKVFTLMSAILALAFCLASCKANVDDPTMYTVTVSSSIEHGKVSVDKTSAEAGATVKLTATADDGYELEAFSVKDASANELTVTDGTFTMPKSNVTVTATFAAVTYTVTFNSNGGSDVESQTVASGSKATEPAEPTKTATTSTKYTFDGWYSDSSLTTSFSFDTAIKKDITLYAKWTETAVTTQKTAGSISYATTTVSKTTAAEAFTNTLNNTGDGTVTYASSKTDVATVNATTGEVTIKGAGETTITATVADSDTYTYATKTASYTLTVTQATPSYTVSIASGIEHGTVTADKTSAEKGATVTLTLSASDGYEFGTLSLTDASNAEITTTAVTEGSKYTFTMPESNVTVSATFKEKSSSGGTEKQAGSISYATASVSKTTDDAAFTNELTKTGDGTVTYASSKETVATVNATTGEVTIKGVGETTITATVADSDTYTYATKTATYTITVTQATYIGAKKPTEAKAVGDIVFNDGSATPYSEDLTLTDDEKNAAIAVIFYVGTECSNDSASRTLGVGLKNTGTDSTLAWARYTTDTDKAEGYSTNITAIQCTPSESGSGKAATATFSGDLDGSDNWQALCDAVSDEGTNENYPAWEWVNAYATENSLEGSYANGWYLPTVAELSMLYRAKDTVNSELEAAGGTKIADAAYWSSSQYASDTKLAWDVWFADGRLDYYFKDDNFGSVCTVRAF